MNYLLIIFCVQNILQISVCDLEFQWQNFKNQFNKSYFRYDEDLIRKEIFASNLELIEEHNLKFSNGLKSFDLGITQFADLTDEEYKKQMNLYENSDVFDNKITLMHNLTLNSIIPIPDMVDWVEFGFRNPVLHQGKCGSCYAFATVASVEGQYYIKHKKLIRLSQQEIVDCGGKSFIGINGCGGGDRGHTFEYIKEKGITYDKNYPYQGKDGECMNLTETPRLTIMNYYGIEMDNEEAMKNAVALNGLVSVGIYAVLPSFKFYKSGVYYDEDCISQLNHAVTIVGYGIENGNDYWLVKNSWGDQWGEQGYIKFARNRNSHCGIAKRAIYPLV